MILSHPLNPFPAYHFVTRGIPNGARDDTRKRVRATHSSFIFARPLPHLCPACMSRMAGGVTKTKMKGWQRERERNCGRRLALPFHVPKLKWPQKVESPGPPRCARFRGIKLAHPTGQQEIRNEITPLNHPTTSNGFLSSDLPQNR